jgi:hypothetical protein
VTVCNTTDIGNAVEQAVYPPRIVRNDIVQIPAGSTVAITGPNLRSITVFVRTGTIIDTPTTPPVTFPAAGTVTFNVDNPNEQLDAPFMVTAPVAGPVIVLRQYL